MLATRAKLDPIAVAMLLVAPASKALCASEARKAGGLPAFHAGKERLERQIEALQHGLGFVRKAIRV